MLAAPYRPRSTLGLRQPPHTRVPLPVILPFRRPNPLVVNVYRRRTASFPDEFYDRQTGDICWRRVVAYLRMHKLPHELEQRRQVHS